MSGTANRMLATLLASLALAGPLGAQGLRVGADGSAGIRVENADDQPLTTVTIHPTLGWAVDCAGMAATPSARLDWLRTGDQRVCAGEISAAMPRRAVMATARGSDGLARTGHGSHILMLDPGEGIVLVAAGAVHNDTDADGQLDAGETISYHYTVLNLGDLALSTLLVSDQSGVVNCPQATLAVGANMVCTRNYAISMADQTAGLIVNQIDVDGFDSAARPVGASDVIISQNLAGRAGVRVFKSPRIADDVDNNNITSIGDLIEYTFVIKNSGAEALGSINLFEPDPTRIDTPISCSATTLGGAAFGANGNGNLGSNDVQLCTAQYTVRASDAAIRQVLNVAEVRAQAPVAGLLIATAASTVVVPVPPQIGVSKELVSNQGIGPGPYLVHFRIVVENFGTVALTRVQVDENLRQTFPLPVTFEVIGIDVVGSGTPNTAFNGISDTGLLLSDQSSLVPGAQLTINLRLSVSPTDMPGPFMNQVVATGSDSINQSVADVSVVGANPDPNGDGDPDEDEPTPIVFNVLIPPLNIPVNSPLMLLLLAALVTLVAARARR